MMDHLEYVGQIVGDYRLLRWLGGGGFGNVYQAQQVRDGQQVAVKMLQIRLSKQDDLRAFINEARTMRLRHPHIVPLLDFGLSRDDTPFLVMEYAPKGTLRDRHPKRTQVQLLMAVSYSNQIASALQYAHDSHLVHRDVKPENMLVRSDGMVLLSDFGIATAAHSTYSLSANQGMVGTVPYMAPEQLQGKPRAASDQYALAVVVYEWIAGRTPFQGTAIEVAMQHATQPPPSLIAQALEVPQEVEAVLFKALAKDYKERFPSMRAFLTALQHASASVAARPPAFTRPVMPAFREITAPSALFSSLEGHTPIGTPSMVPPAVTQMKQSLPETTPSRDQRSFVPDTSSQKRSAIAPTNVPVLPPARKHSLSKGFGVLLILLIVLLIAGGGYAYSIVSNMQRTTVAITHRDATAVVRTTATAARDAYNAAVAQQGIMFGFDAAHTRSNPYEHILNSANVSQLHQVWAAPTGISIDSSPAAANGVVYVGSYDHKLYAFDATTGQQKWAAPTGNSIGFSSPAIANGVVYIGASDAKLYAFDATTGQRKWTAPTKGNIDSSPAIANGVVYIGSYNDELYAFDATTGQSKWTAPTDGEITSSPAIANGMVYVGSTEEKLYAFDATTGQRKWTAPISPFIYTTSSSSSSPAVANGVVYVGSPGGKFYAFDAITGRQKWTAPIGSPIESSSPTVANGVVYVGSWNDKLYAFDATTGRQKWTAPTGSSIYSSPAVANGIVYVGASDGKLYAFSLLRNSA